MDYAKHTWPSFSRSCLISNALMLCHPLLSPIFWVESQNLFFFLDLLWFNVYFLILLDSLDSTGQCPDHLRGKSHSVIFQSQRQCLAIRGHQCRSASWPSLWNRSSFALPLAPCTSHSGLADDLEARARELLEKGADPNYEHPEGGTPFLSACQLGAMGLVQLLVDYRAHVQSRDPAGNTGFALSHHFRSNSTEF